MLTARGLLTMRRYYPRDPSYNINECLNVFVEKLGDKISADLGFPLFQTKTITQKRWNAMLSKLFDDYKILDWRVKNEPEDYCITDGTSYVFKVKPAEGRACI